MGSCLSADGRSSCPYSPTSPLGSRRPVSTNSRRREDQLHRVPGRMFLNGGSDIASLFTQQGRKGINQDAMIVWENFGSRTDTVFCGVFDGHGPFGHMVARRVRDSLPLQLSAHWEVILHRNKGLKENSSTAAGSMNSEETSSISDEEWMVTADLEEIEKHPEIFPTLKDSFLKAFKVMDKELRVHRKIDCFCSGTTAVTLIKQGQDLVIGNIGDSRAILGTRDEDNSLIAIQLTVDLKPNLPREAERIRKCRGRVFALRDEPEVARVWLPNNDSPGLAMARAFGDFCLKDFGLISEPEISYRHLTEKDEFIVLATDGIWDVLSNKEVVDIVASAPSRSSAARTLVESAVRAWKFKYPTSKVDDCAVVCLFLDCSPKNTSNVKPKKEQVSPRGLALGSIKQDPTSPVMLKELSTTARDCPEILPEEDEGSEQVCHVPKGEEAWSALEGVARVNTLLTLPRLIPGGDQKRSAVQKSAREG